MNKSSKSISWQKLESMVKTIAEIKYSATARAETIAGVKCDCVLDLHDGSVVVIEISKERTITKLRTDIAKFSTIKPHYFQKQIFPKCHFVTLDTPTAALIDAGKSHNVEVYSVTQFFGFLLGINNYINQRKNLTFGSAVDIYSGKPDDGKYVGVTYYSDSGKKYKIKDIADSLVKGKTIVLVGDYGSGKSRCVSEIFRYLVETHLTHYNTPIAINLRDNWGLKRANEIITRHFTDMGLGSMVQDFIKVAHVNSTIYLLDGFDEIGAQTWSDDPTRLVEIRKHSLIGVKELVIQSQGGILVAGREHYFNDDAEMLTCMGLDRKDPIILRCNQELDNNEFNQLIGRVISKIPTWVPKKPLIGTIIRDIDPEIIDGIFETARGQTDFWELLIDAFCEREARNNPILEADIIRILYTKIGRIARLTSSPIGPISIKQINDAFEETTHRPPTDESAIILQRLPGLSRIGAESLDRQFADTFILDGLKAEDALVAYSNQDPKVIAETWKHPIESFGAFYLGTKLLSNEQTTSVAAFIKRNKSCANKVLISDLLSAISHCDCEHISFANCIIDKGNFSSLNIGDSALENITLNDSHFKMLDITDAVDQGVKITNSTIEKITGVASASMLPSWINSCIIDSYQNLNTLSQIKMAGLNLAQTFLLSSLRKLFIQSGSARKESSMFKGYGDLSSKKICDKVLALLVREEFCSKHKGSKECLYVPDRSKSSRAHTIMKEITHSKDNAWIQASALKP
ncbi:MAG: hypothetical protein IPO40_18680 [Fibrobacteres bacterium]|nr:hypothetical protein [Fibrobacterota bacterium]